MTRVLVTAATKYGATGEIAQVIGEVLRKHGLDPTVVPPDQVGAAAGRQLHHRRQPGHPLALPTRRCWRDPRYAWTLVACATAVSVALNVAHAPERLAAQLFAALPPVALLGALELLMSVARTGLPHTSRTPVPTMPVPIAPGAALDPTASGNGHRTPTTLALPQDRTPNADQDPAAAADARQQVRVLVARERSGGPQVTAAEVIAVTGRSRRRAYELLRDARTEHE